MDEMFVSAPGVLRELMTELVRRSDEEYRENPAQNSVHCAVTWAAMPPRLIDVHSVMEREIADYPAAIGILIVITTYDLPELILLACDENHMPNINAFREYVNTVAVPILNKNEAGDLPPEAVER
jgi:hypothetical protein